MDFGCLISFIRLSSVRSRKIHFCTALQVSSQHTLFGTGRWYCWVGSSLRLPSVSVLKPLKCAAYEGQSLACACELKRPS